MTEFIMSIIRSLNGGCRLNIRHTNTSRQQQRQQVKFHVFRILGQFPGGACGEYSLSALPVRTSEQIKSSVHHEYPLYRLRPSKQPQKFQLGSNRGRPLAADSGDVMKTRKILLSPISS